MTKEEDYRNEILLHLLKLIDQIQHESGPVKNDYYGFLNKDWVQLIEHQKEMQRAQGQISEDMKKPESMRQLEKKIRLLEKQCKQSQAEINAKMCRMYEVEPKYHCYLHDDFANLEEVSQKVLNALSECEISDHHDR